MSFAQNGPIRLSYDVQGNGPDLLLIAGTASNRALWALVRDRLSERFRTIAFDNRDSGDSSMASHAYTLPDLAADAASVLDALHVRVAHVLGHSMGGAVAQEFALRYPERCATLTLACSWARTDAYAGNLFRLMDALTAAVDDDRTLLATILWMGSGRTLLRTADLFERTDVAIALGPLAPRSALRRQWQLDLGVDTVDRLAALRMPAHVIWAAEDRLLPQPLSDQLASAIPGAVLTRIDACGHVPMIDAPDAFADAVLRRLP